MSSGVGFDVTSDTTPEDDLEPYPYCGSAKSRPRPRFNPYRDVLLGDFVLCRPCDGHRLPVWLSCASSTIDLSLGSNYGTFVVEWWTLKCSKKEPKALVARECWTRRWTPEVIHPQNQCHRRAVLSQNAVTQGQRAPKDAFDPRGISGYGTC